MAATPDPAGPDLVEQARTGDPAAFATLVRTHERRVMSVCHELLADAREAEECVQDAFLKAWRNLARFEARSSFSTWLHRIAVNEALQRLRRRRHGDISIDAPGAPDLEDTAARLDIELGRRAEQQFLVRRLMDLPSDLRAAVMLRDVEGRTNAEVARLLGVTLPAAKARVHRGRRLLRRAAETWLRERDA